VGVLLRVVGVGFQESLGAAGHVPRESKIVLDLTKRHFQNISNVTGRIFEIGVRRLMVVFPQLFALTLSS
jgi:hypothetical protein